MNENKVLCIVIKNNLASNNINIPSSSHIVVFVVISEGTILQTKRNIKTSIRIITNIKREC